MALFKTIDELREYLDIPAGNSITRLMPLVGPATLKYIKPVVGDELLARLETYYEDSDPDPDTELDALLVMVQRPLAHFIFFEGIPDLDLVITDSGFAVVHNQNLTPASKDRVAAFRKSKETLGYDGIEQLYHFLEENEDDYPEWIDSEAYSRHFELFIHSAIELEDYVVTGRSRRKYLDLVPTMKRVERFSLIPVMSEALADKIKLEIASGEVSEPTRKALELIRGAVANLSMAELIEIDSSDITVYSAVNYLSLKKDEKQQYQLAGTRYLSALKGLLDGNISDYPEYAQSDIYDATRKNYDLYENKANDQIFVFG